ncbi:MAG TPA: hypothetical protein VJ697_06740 [Nitrososphaeraceae archaeon]|nr:hypothetical protein [Nitrososphaeraceae archaeon]
MITSLFRVVSIPNELFHSMLVIVPYIFLPVGIIIFILGILLYRKSKKELTQRGLNNVIQRVYRADILLVFSFYYLEA